MMNPYLGFAALLMAGIDGIQNKIHPGEAADKNLYDLPPEEEAKIPTVAHSLDMALEALQADHEFLLKAACSLKKCLMHTSNLKLKMYVVLTRLLTQLNSICTTACNTYFIKSLLMQAFYCLNVD